MRTKTTLLVIAILTSISCNALNYFWVGGSGNWSDFNNHWATTSGGNTFHNQVPQSTDNVFFDALSFTPAMRTVTVDQGIIQCADMIWAGLPTMPPIFNGNTSDTLRIFGSLTLATGMNFNFNGQVSMEAITAKTITTSGTIINASALLQKVFESSFQEEVLLPFNGGTRSMQIIDTTAQSKALGTKVYPNPAQNSINFEVDFETEDLVNSFLIITDVVGRQKGKYNIPAKNSPLVVNTETYSNGIYFYSLYNNGILKETEKFIISK